MLMNETHICESRRRHHAPVDKSARRASLHVFEMTNPLDNIDAHREHGHVENEAKNAVGQRRAPHLRVGGETSETWDVMPTTKE